MGLNGDIVLSSHTWRKELSQRFNTHFTDKIGNIRTTLQAGLNGGYVSLMSSGDTTFEGIPLGAAYSGYRNRGKYHQQIS